MTESSAASGRRLANTSSVLAPCRPPISDSFGVPAMLDESQREEALIHFQRGLNLERAHRVGEAVEEYRRAIARYPQMREAHDALGFYYQRHGLLAKAAEEFRVVASLE